MEKGAETECQILISIESGEIMRLKLGLLFFSIRASDEAEPFFSIPTLHHTPLSAKGHSGSMTYYLSQAKVTALGDIPVPYPFLALSHLRQGARLLPLGLS